MTIERMGWIPLLLAALASPAGAQAAATQLFPAQSARNVNPDTHLVLTFASAPTIGHSGTIRVYDAATKELVDSIDMSVPGGPDPAHIIRVPPKAIERHSTTPSTTTPAVNYMPPNLHDYQLTAVGGLDDFHFYPIIVHGNTATIYLHNNHLQYAHRYRVQIDPGVLTVAGAPFTEFSSSIGWRFSTKQHGPANGSTRLVVAADGSGDFNTVQGAIDFLPDRGTAPTTIFIRDGNYEEIVFMRHKSHVTIRGEDRGKVQVGYGNNSAFNPPMAGPSRRCAFAVYDSDDIELTNFTLHNYFIGQAEALLIYGSHNIVDHMTLQGSGDALNVRGTVYFNDSTIVGDGDTILGVGAAFFNHCMIRSIGPAMWIRNPESNHGNVFLDCTFIGLDAPLPWTRKSAHPERVPAVLARLPNNHGINYPYAEAVLINCHLEGIAPSGWGTIDGDTSHLHFWEYNSTDLKGRPIDVSHRNPASRQLKMPEDAQTIANYSKPGYVLGGWKPVLR